MASQLEIGVPIAVILGKRYSQVRHLNFFLLTSRFVTISSGGMALTWLTVFVYAEIVLFSL